MTDPETQAQATIVDVERKQDDGGALRYVSGRCFSLGLRDTLGLPSNLSQAIQGYDSAKSNVKIVTRSEAPYLAVNSKNAPPTLVKFFFCLAFMLGLGKNLP